MKKTMTINLNGIVFNIDEDAYAKLHQYLSDLGRQFSDDEKDEIMGDIEARIAELFTQKMVNRNVVEIQDVEDVIVTLGQPSQFADSEQAEAQEPQSAPNPPREERKRVRKLYRDTENKRIGGVAAGIAAYMDWDPTLVRILFVLVLLLSVGWTSFIYILMWIFIPEATSVAQKLEMQGVEPNIDNIKTYSGSFESTPPSSSSSNTLAKVLKVIAIVMLGFLAFGLFASILGIFVAVIMLALNLVPGFVAGANEIILLSSVALFLLCPAIATVMLCTYLANQSKPHSKWVAWVLLALWIASIVAMCITGVNSFQQRSRWYVPEKMEALDSIDRPVTYSLQSRENGAFKSIEVEDAIVVKFTPGDSVSIDVKASPDMIDYVHTDVVNNVLSVSYEKDKKFRNRTITVMVTAPVPENIKVSDASLFETTVPIDADNLELYLEDASLAKLSGKVRNLKVQVEEASTANLEDLDADVADIRAEEASIVNMGRVRDLRIQSENASNVTYKGRPQQLRETKSSFFYSSIED